MQRPSAFGVLTVAIAMTASACSMSELPAVNSSLISTSPSASASSSASPSAPGMAELTLGTTSRVSVAWNGRQGNGESYSLPAISYDGRFVAFASAASNLVSGDSNRRLDVFRRDLLRTTTTRVSVDSAGAQANGESHLGAMTPDGRFVVFTSTASNLVTGDTNGLADVFLRDLHTGRTVRVSVSSEGGQTDRVSSLASSISADGRWVAFSSEATTLVPGDTNNARDVFVRDLQAGTTTRVSVSSSGEESNADSGGVSMTADGQSVVFSSRARNLVPDETELDSSVFLHDRRTGHTSWISDSTTANFVVNGTDAVISPDGRWVAFVADNPPLPSELYVRDMRSARTARVATGTTPSMSADGRYLAYTAPGDRVLVRDIATGATADASAALDGGRADDLSSEPALSGDGRRVAFASWATDLVRGDTNGTGDVFVRQVTRANAASDPVDLGAETPDHRSSQPVMAGGVRVVPIGGE